MTNGQESLLALSSGGFWLILFKLPEMLCITGGKRKGERNNLKLKFPLLVVEQGFQLNFLELKCPSFYFLLFQASPSQRDCKATIAIIQIFNDWFQPIKMDYGCYAFWVHPGGISALLSAPARLQEILLKVTQNKCCSS